MTRYTPYEVLFGRKTNKPEQLQQKPTSVYNYDDVVHDIKRKLQICQQRARTNLKQTKQNRVAQQAAKANTPTFYEGDKV